MRTKIKNLRDIANKLLIASTLYMFTENVLACDSSVNKIPIQVNEENKSSLKYFLETGNVKIVFDLNSMLNRHSLYNMKCYGNFSI
ncbi:MAG: hypothetical protein ACXVBA_24165, partial [Mucilaginibacter sp.]